MAHQKVSVEDVESAVPAEIGGMWFLKDALGTEHVGFTVLELAASEAGREHSHEEQEEVYYVVEGGVDVALEGETVPLEPGEALRIDPGESRQIRNRDRRSRLVLVGAPRDAG